MINLLIFGMLVVTIISLSVAFISVKLLLKHLTVVVEYMNEREIDLYEQDE